MLKGIGILKVIGIVLILFGSRGIYIGFAHFKWGKKDPSDNRRYSKTNVKLSMIFTAIFIILIGIWFLIYG